MIVDYISESQYDAPTIYLRTRDSTGTLYEEYINEHDAGYIRPYCWIRANPPRWVMKRLQNIGAALIPKESAKGIDGEHLWKCEVIHPNQLWDIRERCPGWSYEADLKWLDQILLSKFPDEMPEFHPRKWYYDLEWDTGDVPFTTVMAVVDTDYKHPVVFAWKEGGQTSTRWVDRYEGYELREYESEKRMHEGFLAFMTERDPDMLIAHAGGWADLPHLHARLGKMRHRMSPLGVFLQPGKDGYKTTAQPIKGRLVFDTAAKKEEGSGFEGVWQKSGRGQAQRRSLEWFATELKLGHKLTSEIEGMTVHNGWREYYDDFVDYCLVDTTLLKDCDEKLNCTAFHLALQKVAGVQFASTHNVSRYFRGIIGRITPLKAPSGRSEERPALQAAWVMPPVAGRHENVALVDFASLYPNIIISANLCWTTLREEPSDTTMTLEIPPAVDDKGNYVPGSGGTFHWDQAEEGLFPRVVRKLLELRKEYKGYLKAATDDDEKLGWDMLQMAVKVSVNAMYGMAAMKRLQGQWTSYPIAQSITYLGRESISMLVEESEKRGFRGLAGHTDSCYIQVPFEEAETLAEELTRFAQDEMNLKTLDVELEAFFPYWFTAAQKNRNFGVKSFPPSDAGSMKVTGYSLKASSAPQMTKDILHEAFTLISAGEDEDTVFQAIRPKVMEVYRGEIPVDALGSFVRISKPLEAYTKVVPNSIKAARYSNQHLGTEFRAGESVKWLFINGVPEGQPMTNVVGYEKPEDLDGYSIDWVTSVEKWVKAKLKSVYETLEWDLDRLTARRVARRLW
jgi:DNA polymerase I